MKTALRRPSGRTLRLRVPKELRPLLRAIGTQAERQGLTAYVVGGCVRDWLLGVPTMDLDVVVEGDGVALAQKLAGALGGRVMTHQQFGTATVEAKGQRIDFASARRETYAKPAAYPRVSAGTLEDDLRRRDFTINAMAMAIRPGRFGRIVDPFHGLQDLRRKLLRMLHPDSFRDDPSRMLRGIRFAQRFDLRWEPATKRLLREAVRAGALGWLNMGRLRKELDRMLEEPDPRGCLRQLAALLDPSPET